MARKTAGSTKVVTMKEALNLAQRLVWSGTKGEKTAMINANDVVNILGPDRPVTTLDTEVVDELVFELEDRGLELSTINKKLSALSTILGVCLKRGYIDHKPDLSFRKVSNGRIRWITEEEEDTMLYLLKQWGMDEMRDICIVALDTGMRQGELLRMEVRDYNHENRMVSAWENKNEDPRSVPATSRVDEILKRRSKDCLPTAKIFQGLDKWKIRNAWGRIRRHMKLTEDKQFLFHTMRHTCASRMAMEGVPLMMIQKYLGHKAIQTTLRYAHLSPETLGVARDALEKRQQRMAEKEQQQSNVVELQVVTA